MLTPADALKFAQHIADLRLLRARIAASRPDLAGADDAIDDALASLDRAAADLRYAYIAIEDALGEADSIEAGDLIDTPLGTVRALDPRYP